MHILPYIQALCYPLLHTRSLTSGISMMEFLMSWRLQWLNSESNPYLGLWKNIFHFRPNVLATADQDNVISICFPPLKSRKSKYQKKQQGWAWGSEHSLKKKLSTIVGNGSNPPYPPIPQFLPSSVLIFIHVMGAWAAHAVLWQTVLCMSGCCYGALLWGVIGGSQGYSHGWWSCCLWVMVQVSFPLWLHAGCSEWTLNFISSLTGRDSCVLHYDIGT